MANPNPNLCKDRRPRVAIFPTNAVCANFYKELKVRALTRTRTLTLTLTPTPTPTPTLP